MSSTLARLQRWFVSQCDGDWEHDEGVTIESLDNPGWTVRIELAGTPLEEQPFPEIRDRYKEDGAWLICRRLGSQFDAACGPERLEDVLKIFLDWAERGGNRPGST